MTQLAFRDGIRIIATESSLLSLAIISTKFHEFLLTEKPVSEKLQTPVFIKEDRRVALVTNFLYAVPFI